MFQCFQTFLRNRSLKDHMLVVHSGGPFFPCPNAPNCPKVNFFPNICHKTTLNFKISNLIKRFKSKKTSRGHFLICRAGKKIATQTNDEEESDSERCLPVRQPCGRQPKASESQQHESSGFIFKNCTIVIKRTQTIERAVREGYTSFTHVPIVYKGEKRRVWKITGLIGANNRCGSGWVRRKI